MLNKRPSFALGLILGFFVLAVLFSDKAAAIKAENKSSSVVRDEIIVFDSFSNTIKERMLKDRLDNFAMALASKPDQKGYVISYGDPKDLTRSTKMLIKIGRYLNKKAVKADSVMLINGGNGNRDHTELYIAPADAAPLSVSAPTFTLRDLTQ